MKSLIAFRKSKILVCFILGALFFSVFNNVSAQVDLLVDPSSTFYKPSNIDTGIKCTDYPQISSKIVEVGRRLGVEFNVGTPLMRGKDATYQALHGRLGTIIINDRFMSEEVRCQLISHEFIHVLQHLNGDLKGVQPMGWYLPDWALTRFGSLQEAEAYIYQNNAETVLNLLLEALGRKKLNHD